MQKYKKFKILLFLKDFVEINIPKTHSKFSKGMFLKALEVLFLGSFKTSRKSKGK